MDKSKNPPSRNKVGDASNSIADKQLREAIWDKLDYVNPVYRDTTTDQILALFHTYGNRERIDELVTLTPTLVMETECEECIKNEDTISNRIAELNREVES